MQTTEEKTMTNQESLDLIARMIRNTQDRIERGAGKPFLIWGYTTLAVSLAVWYALKTTGNHHWNWLWFAIPAVGLACRMFSGRKSGPKMATTFIDQAVKQIWTTLGICATGLSLYAAFSDHHIPILFMIALLVFAGEAITGGIIKLPYIKFMGLTGMLLSFGLPFLSGFDQVLGFGGLFLATMIVPGHIMNTQSRKACKQRS